MSADPPKKLNKNKQSRGEERSPIGQRENAIGCSTSFPSQIWNCARVPAIPLKLKNQNYQNKVTSESIDSIRPPGFLNKTAI